MTPIFIDLTEDQIEQLKPLMEHAENADKDGLTGMAIAQIFPDQIRCGFLQHEHAKQVQVIITGKSGRKTSSGHYFTE